MSETTSSAHPSRAKILLAFAAVYLIWGSTYLPILVCHYSHHSLFPLLPNLLKEVRVPARCEFAE